MQEIKLNPESTPALIATVGTSYVQGGIKRTVLQKTNFPEDCTVDFNLIEVPNDTNASPHTPPGLEITYVLEGELDLVTEGKPDQRFKPGMSYMVTDSDMHFARVLGDQPIKLLCVFINEKTKPVVTVWGTLKTGRCKSNRRVRYPGPDRAHSNHGKAASVSRHSG